ncbi:MAG: 2Fe-2S iron-sulfur cluster-binding protein [Candidatus Marinamargulisbacteria bacterium]
MRCKLSDYPPMPIHCSDLYLLLNDLPNDVVAAYGGFLSAHPQLETALTTYFEHPNDHTTITPLFIFNEITNVLITLLANTTTRPDDTGEPGSILAYIRANGYDDTVLCSDCYGQLSCSSCAVEVIEGVLDNPTPREEEYDMLDIDDAKPPTQYTRLGCQAKIGRAPLVVKIRAPQLVRSQV